MTPALKIETWLLLLSGAATESAAVGEASLAAIGVASALNSGNTPSTVALETQSGATCEASAAEIGRAHV